MAKREKISEERRKLIQEFIKSNDLKTTGDIQEAIKDLFKDTIQEMLNAELTEHLGYEKNEYIENNENYRNGYSPKTVHSTEGDITLNVPRDRQGTFDPIIVEKGQKDISSIEEKIIRMYARGMSNQNIYEEIQELYGVKVSLDMVNAITDKIIPQTIIHKEYQPEAKTNVYRRNVIQANPPPIAYCHSATATPRSILLPPIYAIP